MYADIVGEIGSFSCLWNLLYGGYGHQRYEWLLFCLFARLDINFMLHTTHAKEKASAFIVMMISEVHRNFYYRITKDNANRCNDKPS